jgi:prolyl-tRNA editing enzyme YbaK/EbsC (Cys-tRNA(Pro) deacylase)
MDYNDKLMEYMALHAVDAEHLQFETSTHSVAEAAEAAHATEEDFVKNICLESPDGELIVAIVKGEDRVSTKRVAKVLEIERPVTASPETIKEKTGFPIGGVPSYGYEAIFLVDEKVMERPYVFTGGGTDHSLVKIDPKEMVRVNGARITRIRK